MSIRNNIGILLIIIFIIGAGVIVYYGRPVMKINGQTGSSASLSSSPGGNQSYTMSQVATHNNPSDCWSAINGGVYDLTDWINRHPGGPQFIIGLCGSDGSAMFNQKHGHSFSAQAALALLQIGDLKQ